MVGGKDLRAKHSSKRTIFLHYDKKCSLARNHRITELVWHRIIESHSCVPFLSHDEDRYTCFQFLGMHPCSNSLTTNYRENSQHLD